MNTRDCEFPHIVHQIWFDFKSVDGGLDVIVDDKTTRKIMNHNLSVISKHEGFKHELWTLPRALAFVNKHYPYFANVLQASYEFDIIKCDFFRYLLMYHY